MRNGRFRIFALAKKLTLSLGSIQGLQPPPKIAIALAITTREIHAAVNFWHWVYRQSATSGLSRPFDYMPTGLWRHYI